MIRHPSYIEPSKGDPKVIGQRIRAAREKMGLTQAELAGAVGTSQQTIEKIELGKVQRSSFIYPIYDVLGLRGPPLVNYNPAPKQGKIDIDGPGFRIRREYLGLEQSELAAMSGYSIEEIERAEQIPADEPRTDAEEYRAVELDRFLARLESEAPLGEPHAPADYYLSAFPTAETPIAYFKMNPDKGISFQGYIPMPTTFPKMVLGFAYCVETAPWVTGIAAGGDRLYCGFEARRAIWGGREAQMMLLAFPTRQKPGEVDRVVVGEVLEVTSLNYRIKIGRGEEMLLDRAAWSVGIIVDAVWANATFEKYRSS